MSGHRHTSPAAAAVLDIGGDVGALLVHTPASLAGTEISLYAEDGAVLTHTEVHRRDVGDGTVHAGLFPGIPAGRYLVDVGGPAPLAVTVHGGRVTTIGTAPHGAQQC